MTAVQKATDDELFKAIVEELKPFRSPWGADDFPSQEDVTIEVREQVAQLRQAVSDYFQRAAIVKTREDARNIDKTIAKLKQQLSKASPELQMRLKLPRRPKLFHELSTVQVECQTAEKSTLTEGRKDQVKRWCVQIAGNLMRRFSSKELTYDDGPFQNITSHIFELVSPRVEVKNLDEDGGEASEQSGFLRLCKEWIEALPSGD